MEDGSQLKPLLLYDPCFKLDKSETEYAQESKENENYRKCACDGKKTATIIPLKQVSSCISLKKTK